jgi:protein-disulfide isomerase
MRFVFRNFPLRQAHPHALAAAEAAEAAGAQGAFWQMHYLLYENQHDLHPDALLRYASSVVPDVELWQQAMRQRALVERVAVDFHGGVRSGVNGTPTFFINGVRHDDSYDLETLEAALRSPPSTLRSA